MGNNNSDKLGRRKALRSIGAFGIGTIGLSSTSASKQNGSTPKDVKTNSTNCEDDYNCYQQINSVDAYCCPYTTTLSSAFDVTNVEFVESTYDEDYWHYTVVLAGESVVVDGNNEMVAQSTSQAMAMERYTDNVGIFTTKNNEINAVYPDPTIDGDIATDVGATLLSSIVTALQSTVGAIGLIGAGAADIMVNELTEWRGYEGTAKWEMGATYSGGVKECVHNCRFYVDTDGLEGKYRVKLISEVDLVQNGWDVEFGAGTSFPMSSDYAGQQAKFGSPHEMSEEEKELFGVKKVTKAESALREGRPVSTIKGDPNEKVFIAERPPVSARPLNKDEMEPTIG